MATDSELAIAASSGDRGALADIYDRYGNTLYELCRVILGDAHEAADAMNDAFVIAATRLSGLRDPGRLKPWLCAIARHEAIRRSSKRARMRPSHDEVLDVPVTDDALAALRADDAFNLVWESAESLTERERAVLMLNVRQGLEGAELAAAAGLPGPATSVALTRAKAQLATAVRCTLLIRSGREACAELAAMAPRKHAMLDGLTRKRVARHAPTCAVCEPTWSRSPDALGVLASAPLLGAPIALRDKVLNDPRLISSVRSLGGRGWRRDGFPPAEEQPRRRVIAALAAAVVLTLAAVGLVLAGDNETPTIAAGRGDSPTTLAEDFEPWPSSGAVDETTTSGKRVTTTTTKKSTTTTARPGAGATPTTAPPTTTTTAPSLTITAGARDASINCGDTTTVTATTHGRTLQSREGLFLHWTEPGGSGGAKNMTQSGSSWTAQLGPFTSPGTVTWWVSTAAIGSGGTRSSNHTIDVTRPC